MFVIWKHIKLNISPVLSVLMCLIKTATRGAAKHQSLLPV